MLNELSEQIRECLDHAEECARKAAQERDGTRSQQDFLNLQKHWLDLARSFRGGERLSDVIDAADGKARASITPFLRDQAFDPETIEAMGKAFVTTCETLGLSERDDALTRLVAEKVIELTQRGLKNPTALHLAVIKEFKADPQ